jgi:DNA polymerase-2
MHCETSGWLLDLYADPQDGLVLWFLDEEGARRRLHQRFPVTFYAAGSSADLRAAWRWLSAQPLALHLARQTRRDLFLPEPVTVLSMEVENPAEQAGLFNRLSQAFPQLTYYDADLQLALRHAAHYGTFPLAHCRFAYDAAGCLQMVEPLETPWEAEPSTPPLRILSIEPDSDPQHAAPRSLTLQSRAVSGGLLNSRGTVYTLDLQPARPLLINLAAILRRHDPDLILTAWGDTWLLPYLLDLAREHGLPLPLNRDSGRQPARREARSYFSYGQVIYQGPQVLLFGRSHVDIYNAMLFHDYGLEGIFELGRVTALSLQTVARTSPGTGISAMQIQAALRQEVLVPWHKQQPEDLKSALDLMHADQGGLVYQPTTGLHRDVAEIDFISMYPSIMVHFNISPETVNQHSPAARQVPELDLWIDQEHTGLIPITLEPLLKKRIALKQQLAQLPSWDPHRTAYKARASAHKWLLVTCFGYLGYKNARFGRIEAHEAVTAYGREVLLRAKEAAEDLGYTVLHLYVDGMWVRKPGCRTVPDFQPLLDEILNRTDLPVALDGIYRWVAFLPSRVNPRVPVPNRYFGVFQDGSLKLRGIETRRRDTPPFLKQLQREMLDMLCSMPMQETPSGLDLTPLYRLLRRRLQDLRAGRIPLPDLLVTHKVSRKLEEFRSPSVAAQALTQLQGIGKLLEPGQHVRFLYLRGEPGVHAWDLPQAPDPAALDTDYYSLLFVRTAATILQPFGVDEATLQTWLFANAAYGAPPGILPSRVRRHFPLLAGVTGLEQKRRLAKLHAGGGPAASHREEIKLAAAS